MRIFVSAHFLFVTLVVRVSEIKRNCFVLYRFHRVFRTAECFHNLVRLRCFGNVDYAFGKRNSAFGQADTLKSLHARRCNDYGVRVCHANVFAGVNHDSARDEHRIATRLDEPFRPVQRGVAVRAAHTLYKSRNHVVIHIFGHAKSLLLNGLLGFFLAHAYHAVRACVRCECGKFKRVESRAHISAACPCDMVQSIIRHDKIHVSESAFFVFHRSFETFENILLGEPREIENAASRHDCARHGHVRIFGCRADKDDISLFYCLQNAVALRLVPTMTFVKKQISAFSVHTQQIACFVDDFLCVGNAARNRVEFYEICVGVLCNYVSKRGFARAGRAVKYATSEFICGNRSTKQRAFAHYPALPQELVERARTHTLGKRCHFFYVVLKIEQIHDLIIPIVRAFVKK